MPGQIDWSKPTKGSKPPTAKTTPTSAPPAAPAGGRGQIDWSNGGASKKAADTDPFATPVHTAPATGAKPVKKQGLLGQLKSVVTGVPAGLVHLGGDVGKSLVNSARLQLYNDHLMGRPKDLESQPNESLTTYLSRVSPASRDIAQPTIGAGRTIGGVAQMLGAPGHGLADETRQRYSDAPVASALSDVAGAALILGPASKGLAAGADAAKAAAATEGLSPGLARAASVTAKAAEIGNKIAASPAKPYEAVLGGAKLPSFLGGRHVPGVPAIAKAGLDKAATSEGRAGNLLRTLKVDPASRTLRREALQPGQEAVSEAVGQQVKLGQSLEKILPKPAEQQAMFLVGEHQADALAKLRSVAPDSFDSFVNDTFHGTVSSEAAHLAADVADGKMPEVAARIDQALQVGREGAGGRTERSNSYLSAKPSRQWQTGFAPDASVIDKATEKAMQRLPQASRLAKTLRQRADSAAATLDEAKSNASVKVADRTTAGRKPSSTFGIGKTLGSLEAKAKSADTLAARAEGVLGRMHERVGSKAAEAANSVEAAAARLRPALEVNRRAAATMADHAKGLRDQGLHDAAASVDAAAKEIPQTLAALQAAGVDPEHFIHVQAGDKPTKAGIPANSRLPQLRKGRDEKFRADSLHFDRSVRAQTQGEIDAAKTVIARQTADKIAGMPFAAKLGQGPLEGIATKEAAQKAGYEPWDPRTPFETPATVDQSTVFLPKHLKDGFHSYFNDPTWDKVLKQTYDPAIQGFKAGVLAFSPSWQVGNVAGNAILATVGAGVDPLTLATKISEAVKAYRASGPKGERSFEDVAPRRLLTAGPTHEEFRYLNPPDEQLGGKLGAAGRKATAPARYVAQKAYNLNEFVDNVGRSAVYLAKKDQGLTDELAVKESLKAMGDFSRMTPFERRVVRRIIPFYAWQRHITQLAFRLPVEHPIRVAWTLTLGDQAAHDDTLPDYLRGAIPLGGGKLLDTRRFFPFGDAGRILEPGGIESSLSPAIKIPIQAKTGVNLSKGNRPFTRPPGSAKLDDYGNPLPTAPSLKKQITDLFPQKRLLESIQGRDKVVRYDSGDKVITAHGPIRTGKSASKGALRFLGVPIVDAEQARAAEASTEKKQLANDKAQARYRARLSRAKK